MSWQEFKSSGLENQFNPRAALGAKTSIILREWEAKSVLARKELDLIEDISYGDHVLQKFDYCKSSSEQPSVILIHGGYWRSLDKKIMDWHVKKLFENGFTVYNVNYPLCPEVSLTKLMDYLCKCLEEILKFNLVQKDNPRFILMGHSAGAHLAMHLAQSPVLKNKLIGIVALSGIYECQVVREISVNADVCLNEKEAENLSILNKVPDGKLSYYIAVGAEEPSGWIDQSVELYSVLNRYSKNVKLRVVNEANHFSLIDKIVDPKSDAGVQFYSWVNKLADMHGNQN